MKLRIYSIYDSAAKNYQRPFYAGQDAEALRAFEDLVNDENTPVHAHPEHYSLHRLGDFDDSTGTIQDETNENLATALAFKEK